MLGIFIHYDFWALELGFRGHYLDGEQYVSASGCGGGRHL